MPDRASCGRRGHPLALKTCFAFSGFESIYLSIALLYPGFALLLAVSKMLFRHHVSGRIGRPLGLNPAGVLPFRNHARQSLLRTKWPPLGLEKPALLLAVSSLSLSIYLSIYCFALPWFCFAFSGFEDAVSAPRLWTNWPSLGLASCWGSAVSQPCPTQSLLRTKWPPLGLENLLCF